MILHNDTYLAMIKGAVGSNQYRHLYTEAGDILEDGNLSCAFFVSALLHHFGWIASPHATVTGLERDLVTSGWEKVAEPQPGDVIIWEKQQQAGKSEHLHSGFWLSPELAVSNSPEQGVPIEHHPTFGTKEDGSPVRAVIALYRRTAV